VEVGWDPDWVAVGQSAGLTGLKSPAATLPESDEVDEVEELVALEEVDDAFVEDATLDAESEDELEGGLHDLRRFNFGAAPPS